MSLGHLVAFYWSNHLLRLLLTLTLLFHIVFLSGTHFLLIFLILPLLLHSKLSYLTVTYSLTLGFTLN